MDTVDLNKDLNRDLTEEQSAVVEHLDGTQLVLAAVGSGKTTALSARIAHAVAHGQDPARILALTFTNRAAARMREGLAEHDEVAARRVWVSTFHALCARILRTDARRIGLPPDFWILDEEDSADLIRGLGVRAHRQEMYTLHQEMSDVPLGAARIVDFHRAAFSGRPWAAGYIHALVERGAVDFAGLVFLTRALFQEEPGVRDRWARRFDLVQVDEVQDTHLSEYEVLRALSARSRSLCMVGDLDQTIYGWRGSQPRSLLAHLEQDVGEVTTHTMSLNFRSTRKLLIFADRIANGLSDRATRVQPHPSVPVGIDPVITAHSTVAEEEAAVADLCRKLIVSGTAPTDIAVLTRTNREAEAVSRALAQRRVPHTTVEHFRFFRRMEVKDALALLRLVVDRRAATAAHRVATKLVRQIGPATLRRIRTEGAPAGLRLVDLLDTDLVAHGDPFWAVDCDEFIVLDTETTGVNPDHDEVIEIAAVRVVGGEITDRFHALIRPDQPVGDSESVHGLSDGMLAAEGRPAAEVLIEAGAFIGTTPIAGHNVRFDKRMLTGHAARVEVELELVDGFDTLTLARRFLRADSYRLEDLAQSLDLASSPTHRAMDDVETTVQLADRLFSAARAHADVRRALIAEIGPKFAKLRERLDIWRAAQQRPAELIARIIDEGGLRNFYAQRHAAEPIRTANLDSLPARIAQLDDPALPPLEAVRHVLDRSALVREQDLLDDVVGVRAITVHQAKGLQFETVIVPGLVEGGFPSFQAVEADDTDEERRLFYVAITRARRRLFLSWHAENQRGYHRTRSRFLD